VALRRLANRRLPVPGQAVQGGAVEPSHA
jgi:hypothetical protein